MSWRNFYVYQYLTEDGTPFYIGKGSKNRVNESHAPWVEIPPPEFRHVIKDDLTEQTAFDLELALIKQYGRKIDGGLLDNVKLSRWVAQAGWTHTEEAKQKISKANSGKVRTAEHRTNYSNPKTIEHAEKIKEAVQNLWNNTEYKAQRLKKIKEKSFAHKGKPWSSARREAQMNKQNIKGVSL